MEKPYGPDLAYIHDIGYGGFALGAAPGLIQLLRRNGVTRGLVVDLGCGSGILAREFTRAGYGVLGVDISPAMIALARRKAPDAKFRVASLLRVKLPACDVVTSIGECLTYCFDPRSGPRELYRLFSRVHDALAPGGVFIFDALEPGQIPGRMAPLAFRLGDDWVALREGSEDRKRGVLTRHIVTFRKAGKLYRRGEETHRLRLYDSSRVAAELGRVGFKVEILGGYGRLRFARGHVGFLARKVG